MELAPRLYRSAWLLCGHHHAAEDLVQDTLAKLLVRWRSSMRGRLDNPAAYAQTVLLRTYISGQRRRSSTERPMEELPEVAAADETEQRTLQLLLVAALEPHFHVGLPVYGPYLYRWDLDGARRSHEEAAIARAEIPAVGARLLARRVSGRARS